MINEKADILAIKAKILEQVPFKKTIEINEDDSLEKRGILDQTLEEGSDEADTSVPSFDLGKENEGKNTCKTMSNFFLNCTF